MFNFFKKKSQGTQRRQFEIRLEAIGGQGAHSAGKILAEAFVMDLRWSGHHFSSFGSEKRGTPVVSHVRAFQDRRPVRSASPILRPDILLIFHELLLARHPESWIGITDQTDVLVNSRVKPQSLRVPRDFLANQLGTIDAIGIALEHKAYPNAVLLGALCKFLPELPVKVLRGTFERFFSHLSFDQVRSNLRAFDEGFREVQIRHFRDAQAREILETLPAPELGWFTAPLGGVIVNPGNSALKNMSASRRGTMPLLNRELCINCGYCDMVCPDYCFVWKASDETGKPEPTLLGIDYHYCKGCQKCVVACPVNALEAVRDDGVMAEEKRVARFEIQNKIESSHEWWQLQQAEHHPESAMLTPQSWESGKVLWKNKSKNS